MSRPDARVQVSLEPVARRAASWVQVLLEAARDAARRSPAPRAPGFKFHLNQGLLPLVLLAGLAVASPGLAEEAKGRRMYAELGQLAFDEEEGVSTVGLRWGSVTPGQPSLDFALPFVVSYAIVTTPDLDLALPIPVAPGVRVIPRAGASAIVVLGGEVGFYAFGWNAGAGVVLNAGGPVLLRADYTVRSFSTTDSALDSAMHAASVGLGWKF